MPTTKQAENTALYIATAIRRWQNLTGHDAVRAADGRLFREIEAEKEDADER